MKLCIALLYVHFYFANFVNSNSLHPNFHLLPIPGECGIEQDQNRIWGGFEAGLDELPWMVLIKYTRAFVNMGFQCGGSLINEKYVLTAAHCLVGEVASYYGAPTSVRLGEHDTNSKYDCDDFVCNVKADEIDVVEIVSHRKFDKETVNKYNDIGLLRLAKAASYRNNIQPICLPRTGQYSEPGDKLLVAGWGLTETRGKLGIDSCNGDSGGPLMSVRSNGYDIYYIIEGIVSFGYKNCGTEGIPAVYTKVIEFIPWILDNIYP